MTNILNAVEAANVLRCENDDALMLDLLPGIDAYLENATGRDWTGDSPIYPAAKAAARILLVRAHEDPGALSQPAASLSWGLQGCLAQLEGLALTLESSGVPDETLALESHNLHTEMAITADLVLVFNHELAAAATSAVTLENSAGANVAVTNSLDATGKILTVNPTANLTAANAYTLVLTAVPDIYGQTITDEIGFWTA